MSLLDYLFPNVNIPKDAGRAPTREDLAKTTVQNTPEQFNFDGAKQFGVNLLSFLDRVLPKYQESPALKSQASPTPTPVPTYHFDFTKSQPSTSGQSGRVKASEIEAGLSRFGSGNTPIASASGQLAQAGSQLPSNIDPYLPAVLALMETGGGSRQVGQNNPFNIRGTQGGNTQFINYPDVSTAILGGQNGQDVSKGLLGLLLSDPKYAGFRNSGDLRDFFNVYTPPGEAYGNPSMDQLLSRYAAIRSLFGQ